MPQQLPIYGGRPSQVIAVALVDEEDYPRVAGYRWWMQGTPEAPRYVYRRLTAAEQQAGAGRDRSLAQELSPQPGRITFRNGDPLDCRQTNLMSLTQRQHAQADAAQQVLQATRVGQTAADAASVLLPLTQGWTVSVDVAWAERLAAYAWAACVRGANVYAVRRVRRADRSQGSVFMARVIMGLQALEDGTRLGAGLVTLRTAPDLVARQLDLQTANLLVTTRSGINLRRPTRSPYRGVQRHGRQYRAHLKIGGQERVLGLYATPEAAAQARAEALRALGLQTLAWLQPGPAEQEGPGVAKAEMLSK
ncbi:MAG: hypothetical protein AB7N91_10180 [Candidatus Tectimicrobiota bacterium]